MKINKEETINNINGKFIPAGIRTFDSKNRITIGEKIIKYLTQNPRHTSMQTHIYHSLQGPSGEKIFEAYAEQSTSAAYRIFFYYGPCKGEITIFAIIPHP